MAIKLIDVSLSNPALSIVRARTYQRNYTPLPNNILAADLLADLNVVYSALSGGNEVPVEDFTFLVKAKDGYLARLHSPIIGKNADNKMVIRWGNVDFEVDMDSEAYNLKVGSFDFSGRGLDVCLFITVKVGKDAYRMPLPLRLQNWDDKPTLDDTEYLFSEDFDQFIDTLGVLPTRGESTGSGGEELISLRDLEVDAEYEVVGYKEVKTSYGTNFIIEFKGGIKSWSHKCINQVLRAKPTISATAPATLKMLKKNEFSPGKFSIDAVLILQVSAQSVSLDF